MGITMIAAMSKNGVIGKNNELPWHISEDLKYFRAKTRNKPVVMGRKTHESIGVVLPGRMNIILTRNTNYYVNGAVIVNNIKKALEKCNGFDEVMIIGGAEIYKQALEFANKIYLTIIDREIDGDAFFPELGKEWKKISTDHRDGDPSFSFNTFERIII